MYAGKATCENVTGYCQQTCLWKWHLAIQVQMAGMAIALRKLSISAQLSQGKKIQYSSQYQVEADIQCQSQLGQICLNGH